MADDVIHELTAAYALDALDAEDERAYVEHLARCERCRNELAELSEVGAALAYAVPPAAPPPALRERILTTARAERPNVVPLRPRWTYPVAAAAAVAACAAIGLGVWAARLHDQLGTARTALHAVTLQGASGSLVVGGDRQATLVLTDLDRAPAGKTYEAWVIRGGVPAPAGTFASSGATTVVRLTRPVPAGSVVAVTLERAGGTTKPTTTPVVVSARA
jgi:anti-sigma-K factor RskA